jgi:hypothetical protein
MAPKASACNWNNGGREDLECEIVIKVVLLGKSRLDPEYGARLSSFVSTKGACGRGPELWGAIWFDVHLSRTKLPNRDLCVHGRDEG